MSTSMGKEEARDAGGERDVRHEMTQSSSKEDGLDVYAVVTGDPDSHVGEEEVCDGGEGDLVEGLAEAVPSLQKRQAFGSVLDFRKALREYAIRGQYSLKTIYSDRRRVTAKCDSPGCNWRIHASRHQDGHTFIVKTMSEEHSCISADGSKNRMASYEWVAEVIESHLHEDPEVKVGKLKEYVKSHFGVDITYSTAWRAKERAMARIQGSQEEQYKLVPSFCQAVLDSDPMSIAKYRTESDNSFERLFICFIACSRGFLDGCRPFINLVCYDLKHKYGGYLLTSVALDADNGIFPLAYAVVEDVSADSWIWFLDILRTCIGLLHKLIFLSDRSNGVGDAIRSIFPHAVQSLSSYFSTSENIASDHWTEADYLENVMVENRIKNLNEPFHKCFMEARCMPVIDCVDFIRRCIMEKFQERRDITSTWNNRVVPTVDAYLAQMKVESRSALVLHAGGEMFEVDTCSCRHVVSLNDRTCSCRRWQASGLPCLHAVKAIMERRQNLEDYCSPYFSIEAYRRAYAGTMVPLTDKRQWPVLDVLPVTPPRTSPALSWPAKKRKQDYNEAPFRALAGFKQTSRCGACNKLGHNKRTCKEQTHLIDWIGESTGEDSSTTNEGRKMGPHIGGRHRGKRLEIDQERGNLTLVPMEGFIDDSGGALSM